IAPYSSALWFACALASLLGIAKSATAQIVQQDLYVTNGTVRSVALSNGILYLAGTFTQVGPATGTGVPISATTGQAIAPFARVSGGAVNAVVSDGSGGWYIGGTFTAVNQLPRTRLAHVLSDGSVASWYPSPDGTVYALASSGGIVYAGGEFTTVSGTTRSYLAAIDGATGEVMPWNANANNFVRALAVKPGVLYAGGDFSSAGNQPRQFLAGLDLSSGNANGWNPNATGTRVNALVLGDSTIYVGGQF